jgi:hypothetical protein
MESLKRYFSLGHLASYSMMGLVFISVIGFNLIRDFPPEERDLKIIQGSILVIEPNYAHIKYGKDTVKIEYTCLCSHGWKENKLSSSANMQAWVTEKSGDYKAWKLILDNKPVLNNLEVSRSNYIFLGVIFSLTFLFIGIIVANKVQQKRNDRLLDPIFEDLERLENPDISVEERMSIVDKLIQIDDERLIFAFADLGTLNILPENLQKKIGYALGYFLAKNEESPDDFSDMLNVLQPVVKAAALVHFAKKIASADDIPIVT